MKKQLQKHSWRGATLIEGLVALFVFSLMAITFYSAFSLGMTRILDAQKRLQAMTLATEQMEKIRNLAYEDVGFNAGVPACVHCSIVPEEQKVLEGATFFIVTGIQYRDDPDDGTLVAGTDAVPTDYKRVLVRVEWGDRGEQQRVEMISRFVPPGMEQGIPNTGALSINVFDYSGIPVENVHVEITGIAGNFFTDGTGNVFLLGIPISASGYPLRLTKGGYETLETLPFPPAGAFPPKNPPVVVADGAINVGNFELNPLTDITFHVEDPFGHSLPGIEFLLSGGRRLDNNPTPTDFEYVNESNTSDLGGDIRFSDRSGGSYTIGLSAGVTDYVFWKTSLVGELPSPVVFPYGGTHTENIFLINRTIPGMLVRTASATTGLVLSGATVRVIDGLGTYDETQTTDAYGLVYFPDSEGSMVSGGTYTVRVEASGFTSQESIVTVSSGLENVVVNLDEE
jgi:hypothetical protein